ncbi:MAG: FapA family protein, partial [Spirochaetaceae bacterium]|nr:FapA family protein [Spirochaetaceae bacterium]
MEEQEKNRTEQTNRILLLPGGKNDANVSVIFSEDKLELRADFYPPMAGGKPLSVDYIASALNRLNVVYGILWENIQRAVTSCNLNHKIIRDLVIARGNPPVNEVLEYYQINPNLKAPEPDRQGNDRIDHRSYSPFIIVKKGQALAKLKSRKAGKEGKDIYGTVLPHGTLRPEGVSAGANTRSDGTFIYADINGQLVIDKGVLTVQNSLVVKGAVDYRTGHIIFPGDVEIEGPVSDGFKIYSGGSVTIKQTFDVTDAITKTDLTVSGGIIGRGRALVKVGG